MAMPIFTDQPTKGIFVTGTDTGLGKTVIAAALLAAARAAGLDAVYLKPVQTGGRRRAGKLTAPDLEFTAFFAGRRFAEEEQKYAVPYCFRQPCSPHLAAQIERRSIRFATIMKSFDQLKRRHDFVIVEGAGGIFTPLSFRRTMLDLAQALDLPVILVARPGLGTINHTLLTLRMLKAAGLNVPGLVLNYSANRRPGLIEAGNKTAIERLGKTRVICEFPFLRDLSHTPRARRRFQKTALEKFIGLFCGNQ